MKKPKRTMDEIGSTFIRLAHESQVLKLAREELRVTASNLAGVELEGWSQEDLMGYCDLFIEAAQAHVDLARMNRALIMAENILEGILLAQITDVMKKRRSK